MPGDYDFSLDREAVTAFAQCSAREQRFLLDACERLARHPFSTGDCPMPGEGGRENELLDLGEFVVTFWTDHAVRVVRVANIERT